MNIFIPKPILVSAYKVPGFHYKALDFNLSTFSLNEIFNSETEKMLNDESQYLVTTVSSLYFGRCYTVTKLEGVPVFDPALTFNLKMDWDIVAYIHIKGDELWLMQGIFRVLINDVTHM